MGFASGNTAAVLGVRFISPLIGIRTSVATPFLTRSVDGGQTWTIVTNLPVANILQMNAVTGVNTTSFKQLWISGDTNAPFILSSIDGGTTWQQQAIVGTVENSVYHISAVSFGAMSDSVQAWGVTLNQNTFATGGQILSYRQRIGFVTGVKEQANIPTEYTLSQNYPNPFNPTTTIAYHLPRASQVKLVIYNLAGQRVRTLVDAPQAAGRFQINWDGKDDVGNCVASGVYLYRLEAGGFAETKKMILMR